MSDLSNFSNENNIDKSGLFTRKQIRILIGIVIVIMIIVGLLIIMIIYLGPNKTDNESNSFNIKNDASTVIPPQIYEVGHGGALDSTQPCSSHTVINDITRSINNQQSFSSCDNGPLFQTSIGGRWIRFVGTGGTILSNRYPGRKHCGGFLSGWSNMTLPTVVNTIVNETVCFDSISSEWNLIIGIRVVKCTDFYVYFLPPIPLCNSRYCTM